MIAYIPRFSALMSRLTALPCGSTRATSFLLSALFLISTEVVYLQRWHGWSYMKLQLSRRRFFIQSHIHKVYACLSVTCHLHFRQNDRDLLRAAAVTRGWNGYRNKSQHRKSTLEEKILPPLLQGFEPVTFQSRVRRFNHWAISAHLMLKEEDGNCVLSMFILHSGQVVSASSTIGGRGSLCNLCLFLTEYKLFCYAVP